MMKPQEIGKMMRDLRSGKDVVCPECQKGRIRTPYNPQTSKFFKCDKCNFMINED